MVWADFGISLLLTRIGMLQSWRRSWFSSNISRKSCEWVTLFSTWMLSSSWKPCLLATNLLPHQLNSSMLATTMLLFSLHPGLLTASLPPSLWGLALWVCHQHGRSSKLPPKLPGFIPRNPEFLSILLPPCQVLPMPVLAAPQPASIQPASFFCDGDFWGDLVSMTTSRPKTPKQPRSHQWGLMQDTLHPAGKAVYVYLVIHLKGPVGVNRFSIPCMC